MPAEVALGLAYSQLGDKQTPEKYLAEADFLRSLQRNLGEQFERALRNLRQSVAMN